MTSTANQLITNFNLEDQHNTVISFFYRSVPLTYLICFDSSNKNRTITRKYIQAYSNVGIYRDSKPGTLNFSTPLAIEKFNGNPNGIFVVYDLAYAHIGGKKSFREHVETYDHIKTYRIGN